MTRTSMKHEKNNEKLEVIDKIVIYLKNCVFKKL